VEIKCQLNATEVFIADLIACSTCSGHHYAHHQELKSIIQWLLPVVFRAAVFKLLVWCRAPDQQLEGPRPWCVLSQRSAKAKWAIRSPIDVVVKKRKVTILLSFLGELDISVKASQMIMEPLQILCLEARW